MGKTWVYPESVTPYGIFRYIVKGRAEFCIDDKTIIVRENQIVYIPQGSRMSCKVCSETFEFYSIRFTTSVFYEGEDVLTEYYGIPRVLENEGEDIFFQEIYKWVRKDARVKKCFVRGYLDLLIGSLAMRGSKVDKDTGDFVGNTEEKALNHRAAKNNDQVDPRIYMVANYIILHPQEKYNPQKMAKMAGLSKQRFSSLFKENMGVSFHRDRAVLEMDLKRGVRICAQYVSPIRNLQRTAAVSQRQQPGVFHPHFYQYLVWGAYDHGQCTVRPPDHPPGPV